LNPPGLRRRLTRASRDDHVDRRETGVAHLQAREPDRGARARGQPSDGQAAFANLKFGDWSRILVGQINRGHYCFAVDGDNQVQGFMGWAFADRDKAEAWVEGVAALSFEDSRNGDCMVINAWSANSTRVTRFLLAEMRRIGKDKTPSISSATTGRHHASGTAGGEFLRAVAYRARHRTTRQ
jgi:hypothetical protein